MNLRLEIGDLYERGRVIQFVACDESFEQQQQHHQPQHRPDVEQQQAASSSPTVVPDVEHHRVHDPLSPIAEKDSRDLDDDEDEARETSRR